MRAAIFVCAIAASACGGGASRDDGRAAKAAFWDAFHSGDIEGIPAARERLIAALNESPSDDEAARLIGMSYNLTGLLGAQAQPPVNHPDDAGKALEYLKLSTTIPVDPKERLFNSAFYDATLVAQAAGAGDTTTAQQANAVLEQVVQEFPVYGLFDVAAVESQAPAASSVFQKGLDAYFRAYEICTGGPIDRANPDLTRALHGPYPDPLCGNTPNVPHHLQGELFLMADALVKNRQPDAARALYAAIKESDGYDTWTLQSMVDERLSKDLTAQPGAGPPNHADGVTCFGCHQR
jgi:hypothetical protein